MEALDITAKSNVAYCIPTSLRDEQIKINITKVSARIQQAESLIDDPIAIVCYAPSLNETWEEVKNFKYVMTCSGAHKFLVDRGIVPTWHVDLEPREHKIDLLGEPQEETEYLIASTVHPKYLDRLAGFNVKLWHIFSNDGDAASVLPRGEWAITGGSSVGLRCMTLARFLGFRDMHVFGMDGNFRENGQTHTSEHPNAPKLEQFFTTEYKGKTYLTNPSLLHCAKETMHELNQMSDVNAKFYGDGLTQELMKDYVRVPMKNTLLAFNRPELISEEYRDLNRRLHLSNPTYGMGGSKHKDMVLKLSKQLSTTSILDYGCGKGLLAKELPFPIWEYDPAVPEKSAEPNPADIVVCTDVLEHIEPDKLLLVLNDLKRCVRKVGYLVISTRSAVKTYANGKNTHSIVKGKEWWTKELGRVFEIGTIIDKGHELHVVVGPKTESGSTEMVREVEFLGQKVQFYVPNDVVAWRVDTLFKKEPITIEWLKSMQPGETLIDVGANMGGYSMLASKAGVKVIALEPEAENYALLQRNIVLNNSDAIAYCLAASNETRIDVLALSQREAGGSCHTFGGMGELVQGCVGFKLDDLNVRADHLKIDVDGTEPDVVQGAHRLLSEVKSILVEVNTNLPSHQVMVENLRSKGFEFDQAQVNAAVRKKGPFVGCAEYLFKRKKLEIEDTGVNYSVQQITASLMLEEPFEHLYVTNVFPDAVYADMVSELPVNYVEIERSRGTKGYPKRFTADLNSEFWSPFKLAFLNGKIKRALLDKFNVPAGEYTQDLLLVRDEPGYSIAPHTDSSNKVITVLFYLPQNDGVVDEGTSLFVPKLNGFTCRTGKHYNFDDFKKMKTVPFKPNSMLAFARTDNSFHGVEPTRFVRDVLLYNINKSKIEKKL